MSSTPTWTPMPADLADLTPPTRDDAISLLEHRHYGQLETWERSTRGQQCERGMYGGPNGEMCREYRRVFDQQREGAIEDALATCQRTYERQLERKARIEAENAIVLEAETATLRQRYLEQPGATVDGFEKALPELLEARRRQAALDGMSQQERMAESMRGNLSI